MLPVEHDDPINAKILAISEDKIEGFVREPFEEIARRSGVDVDVVMARDRGHVARGNDSASPANVARDQSGRRRAGRLESSRGQDRQRIRLDVPTRSVFRSRRLALDRHRHRRLGLQTLDDAKGPHGFSLQRHGELLAKKVGAEHFRLMPAKGIFTLGVGHVRAGKRSSPEAKRMSQRK